MFEVFISMWTVEFICKDQDKLIVDRLKKEYNS